LLNNVEKIKKKKNIELTRKLQSAGMIRRNRSKVKVKYILIRKLNKMWWDQSVNLLQIWKLKLIKEKELLFLKFKKISKI
jgi:hypothetical protein